MNGKVEVESQLAKPCPQNPDREHKLFTGSLYTRQGSELSLTMPGKLGGGGISTFRMFECRESTEQEGSIHRKDLERRAGRGPTIHEGLSEERSILRTLEEVKKGAGGLANCGVMSNQ